MTKPVLGLWVVAAAAALGVAALTPVDGAAAVSQASITFNGNAISISGKGASAQGNRLTINAAGEYRLQGKLNGQIIVDAPDAQRVRLILNNASVASAAGAALEVRRAEQVEIELAEGSVNQLSDAARNAADEVNAALYSREDLALGGTGSLLVRGNHRHGIVSRDTLKITGGAITVQAVGDGLRGRDAINVHAGTLLVTAGGDGLQADNTEAGRGTVTVHGGALTINAQLDAIQAQSALAINGGVLTLSAGGGVSSAGSRRYASASDVPSGKGLKAGTTLTIKAGALNVDARENALHADEVVAIEGGKLQLKSGNAGVHADQQIRISNGDLRITESYEGVESAAILLTGGSVHLASSDDGVNVNPVGGRFIDRLASGGANAALQIRGGYLHVDAGGDGIDVGASIEMTGGTVLVNGPSANMNSALDYDGDFRIAGGLLVAAGSGRMAQAPGNRSTQNSVRIGFSSNMTGGTPVSVADESGKVIVSFVPSKAYQSLVVSSPALQSGKTYVVYTGGKPAGSAADGLYSVTSAGATEALRFTVSGVVTAVGSAGSGGRSGGRGMGGW